MIDLRMKLPEAIMVEGSFYPIKTDFRVWIEFGEIIKAKKVLLKDLYFIFLDKIPKSDFSNQLLDFYICEEITPKKESSNINILDWVQDGSYIYGSFMAQYNIDLLEVKLHWHKFKALFMCLEETAKINQIMSFRGYENDSTPLEKKYEQAKNAWKLPQNQNEELLKEIDELFYNS